MAPPSLPTGSSRPASGSGPLRPRVCTHFAFEPGLWVHAQHPQALSLSRALSSSPAPSAKPPPPAPSGHVPRPVRTKPSRRHGGRRAGRASGACDLAGPSIVTSGGVLSPPPPAPACPPSALGWQGLLSHYAGDTRDRGLGRESRGARGLRVHPADPRGGPARPPGSREALRPLETSDAVPLPPGQSSPRGHTPSPERPMCAEELLGHTHLDKIINAVTWLEKSHNLHLKAGGLS